MATFNEISSKLDETFKQIDAEYALYSEKANKGDRSAQAHYAKAQELEEQTRSLTCELRNAAIRELASPKA